MGNELDVTDGYPEVGHPPWGHPLYNLWAHLFNAISRGADGDPTFIRLTTRKVEAGRAFGVARHYVGDGLRRAADAIADIEIDTSQDTPDAAAYLEGFRAGQNASLQAVYAVRDFVLGDFVGTDPLSGDVVPGRR